MLYTFGQQLPLDETPDLALKWDYFYERSIGCVGILKDWLTRSLALALAEHSSTLLPKHTERRALSIAQCNSILSEAVISEKELEENAAARETLRKELGLHAKTSEETQMPPVQSDPEESLDTSPSQQKGRVGTRKAKRDQIGKKVA